MVSLDIRLGGESGLMILVEYRCGACGGVSETLATWPFPADLACGRCGGAARRVYSTAGLRRSGERFEGATADGLGGHGLGGHGLGEDGHGGDGCGADVPGGCALPAAVAPVWAARVRGDDKALRAATLKQEQYLERTGQTPHELAATIRTPARGDRRGSDEPGA
jgi:predicted nucleic acid-binding Zn ribbon protein